MMKVKAGNMNTDKISNINMIIGWLLDVYPIQYKMVLWIKQNDDDNSILRMEDNWTHSIFVAGDNEAELKSLLFSLLDCKKNNNISPLIKEYKFVSRYERIIDPTKSVVLQCGVQSSLYLQKLDN
jgi:hypothetical protein